MPRHRLTWFVFGSLLGSGLLLAVLGLWPTQPAWATATHGDNNFAICTGDVDEDVEAFYFLDFATGDLRAAVLNMQTGKFLSTFSYNVNADLAPQRGVAPHYLMVTGRANLRRNPGAGQTMPARSVVYITNTANGMVGAYVIPWNGSAVAAGQIQQGTFVLLSALPFRSGVVRDKGDQ